MWILLLCNVLGRYCYNKLAWDIILLACIYLISLGEVQQLLHPVSKLSDKGIYWEKCTPDTAHCTLHIAHCTLHTAHCTLHTAHCIMHTALYLCHHRRERSFLGIACTGALEEIFDKVWIIYWNSALWSLVQKRKAFQTLNVKVNIFIKLVSKSSSAVSGLELSSFNLKA